MAIMIHGTLAEAWKEIEREIIRASSKHPNSPSDPLRRTAITVEEALEAIREMVVCTEELMKCGLQVARVGSDEAPRTAKNLRKELVHTAAMCVRQLAEMIEDEMEAVDGTNRI